MNGEHQRLTDHADAFAGALAQARRHTSARRQRTRRLGAVGAAALAAGVSVAAIPQLRDAAKPLDVVAEAKAAVASDGAIVHYVVAYSGGMADAQGLVKPDNTPKRCRSHREEGWISEERPARWRIDTPANPCSTSIDGLGNATKGRRVRAFDGEILWDHAPDDGWATAQSDVPAATRRAPSPGVLPPGNEVVSASTLPDALQALLGSGKLKDTGVAAPALPGTRVLRGSWTTVSSSGGVELRGRHTFDYVVDATSFAPRSLRVFTEYRRERTGSAGAGPRSRTMRIVTLATFTTYERLPISGANADRLFRPTLAQGTRVQRMTNAEFRRTALARSRAEEREGRRRAREIQRTRAGG